MTDSVDRINRSAAACLRLRNSLQVLASKQAITLEEKIALVACCDLQLTLLAQASDRLLANTPVYWRKA